MIGKEYGEPHRRYIDPDRLAGECDDQLPLISKIGRGPRGHGVTPRVRTDQPGEYVVEFVDDVTGEVVLATANLSAGEVTVTVDTPENPVAGDTVMATIHVRLGNATRDYSLPIPPGATGSIFFEVDGEVAASHDGTYRVDVGRLASWGNLNRPSRPVPRVNDMVVFTTPTGFGFGTIEAVENGQVIFTSRTGFELPEFGVTKDGHLTIDGEDTGVSCVGPAGQDAVSPDLTVTRESDGVSIVATDHRGTTEAKVLDGTDGVSPTIVTSRIDGGHRLDIDSAAGEATVDVMDGTDGEDGLPATIVVRSVTETQQPTVTIQRTDVQTNTFSMDFGLPRGADGKSIDIQGGVYKIDQLPDFDDTPVNRAFIVSDYEENEDYRYDLYIRGIEPVIAEEGGPWTVVEDWQGMPGFSMRYIHGIDIDADAPIQVAEENLETTFVPSAHIADGDLVIDDHGCLGVVGSATDNNGYVTVTYVTKLQVHWDDVLDKPSDLVHTADLTAAIAAEASARDKADKLLATEVDGKLGPDDIVAGEGISVTHDPESGHVTIDNAMEFYECKEGTVLEFDGMLHSEPSARPLGMTVYGTTRQNLWTNPSGESNGITATENEDGSLTVGGTSTAGAYINGNPKYILRPGTQYTVSVSPAPVSGLLFQILEQNADGDRIYRNLQSDRTSLTFTTSSDTVLCFMRATVMSAGTTVSGTYRVMLNEGDTAEPWCPPGLNGVDELSIVTAGKNLLPENVSDWGTTRLASISINGDDVTVSSSKGSYERAFVYMNWLAGHTVDFGYESQSGSGAHTMQLEYMVDGVMQYSGANKTPCAIPSYATSIRICLYSNNSNSSAAAEITYTKPYLRIDGTAEYAPLCGFTETPIDLLGHTLNSLPDGTCDELTVDASGNVTLVNRVRAVDYEATDFIIDTSDFTEAGLSRPYAGGVDFSSRKQRSDFAPIGNVDLTAGYPMIGVYTQGTITRLRGGTGLTEASANEQMTKFKSLLGSATWHHLYPLATPQEISLPGIAMPEIQTSDVTMYAASNVPTEMRACLPTEDADKLVPVIESVASDVVSEAGAAYLRPSNIIAGTNVSVSVDGNDVTISATGGSGGDYPGSASDPDFKTYIGY